jgi:hypothetical protein
MVTANVRAAAQLITAKFRAAPAKAKAAFWKAMRTDQVRPFVWVYYVPLLIWGIYGTFFGAPPTYVEPVMGNLVYDLWAWLHIIGTVTVMSGLHLEEKAEPGTELGETAIRLQAFGHSCMFFVLLAYELSALNATAWGQDAYSIFVISPYLVGCLLLAAQGVVKIADSKDGGS